MGPCIFDNKLARKNKGQAPFETFSPRIYNHHNDTIITHIRQARECGQVLALAPCPTPSAPKQWKFLLRVKTRSVQDRHRQNNIKEREYTECSNIKESVHLRAQCQSGVLGLLRLNIKARHEIPDFLNANL